MHTPVLLKEAIDSLDIQKDGCYIDATAGEAGHLRAILDKGGRVLAIDIDQEQVRSLKMNEALKHVTIVQGNFSEIEKIAKENHFYPVDGIIFDLGLSLRQIRLSGRGFSYEKPEEILDMRLDQDNQIPVYKLINSLSQKELYEILAANSEELNSRSISDAIVFRRLRKSFRTVKDLTDLIDQVIGRKDKKVYARVFQAFRIEVNHEFDNLKKGLVQGLNLLKPKGRMVIITFHSLEDRIVKNFIRNNYLMVLNKKAVQGKKSFERSAKLRVIIKK